jgi:hypothetical protein
MTDDDDDDSDIDVWLPVLRLERVPEALRLRVLRRLIEKIEARSRARQPQKKRRVDENKID